MGALIPSKCPNLKIADPEIYWQKPPKVIPNKVSLRGLLGTPDWRNRTKNVQVGTRSL